jgi:hypothetical protein
MLSDYHSHIRDGAHVGLKMPSGILKIVEVKAEQYEIDPFAT